MKKQTILTFFVLITLGSISAMAQSTHSIWTNDNGLVIRDAETGCEYTSTANFNMATSWTEPTPPNYPAIAHFRGISKAYGLFPCNDHEYDFTLVNATATGPDEIKGEWNVYRDGTLMCSACNGAATSLSSSVGSGYKLYVDDPLYGPSTWLYSGIIDQRKDF